ncbi:transmembrane protein 89 [Manis javanica]|uniref:transmembrane protein 89 n=1 Tax=Manis javanica TaxID=9974 RepID=UPI003C6CC5CA
MGGCSPEPLGEGCGSLEPASWSRATPGEGCLPVARRPGSRLTAAMPLTLSFLLCLLLAMPAPSRPWARPLWYQVGLDLQPWGCQPEIPEGCRGSLGCLSHWVSLGVNYVYPVALATLAAALVLAIGQLLQRRLRAVAKAESPSVTADPAGPWKRRTPICSDRTVLHRALHMLDALLLQIEGHLRHQASQQRPQIKGTPPQSG